MAIFRFHRQKFGDKWQGFLFQTQVPAQADAAIRPGCRANCSGRERERIKFALLIAKVACNITDFYEQLGAGALRW